jgi:hypothetical protein
MSSTLIRSSGGNGAICEHLPQHRAPLIVAGDVALDPLIDVLPRMPVVFAYMLVSQTIFHDLRRILL